MGRVQCGARLGSCFEGVAIDKQAVVVCGGF